MRKLKYLLLGGAFGSVVGLMAFDVAFPSVDPSIWREFAETTGLWPSTGVTPVLWRKLVSFGCAPTLVSALSVGLLAFAVFNILWRLIALMVCPQDEYPNWWRLTVPVVALLGGALAVMSEPVWRLALSGAPALLPLSLFVLACDLFLVSFFTELYFDDDGVPVGRVRSQLGIYAAFLLSGALAVETPVALVLPFLFVAVHRRLRALVMDGRYRGHPEDLRVFAPARHSSWIAFFLWLAGVACVLAVSGALKGEDGLLRYLVETIRSVKGTATPLGWLLWTGCTLVPFALAGGLLPVLTARDRRLEFGLGVVTLLVGAVSLAAVSPAARGDWALVSSAAVHAPFMQALGAFLSASSASLSLAVFAYFAFHVMPRDYAPRRLVVAGVGLALIAALAVAGAGFRRGPARQVREAIADAMEETIREAKGLKWIFTDGSADVGVELVARRRHQDLRARPLITGGPFAAPTNSAIVLRDWLSQDASDLKASAVQVGFELWKRERKPAPPSSGLLARADWLAGERERGIAVAERLGARMAELSKAGALEREVDSRVRDVFAAVLWRISRMARQRGDEERADALDEANGVVRQMMERVRRERTSAFMQLTDSEGLQLALKRADFVEARRFAAGVLKRLPDDVSANFGMGMSYLMEKKPQEAILYLERAHKGKPTEPAILNNLAIAWLLKGDVGQAEAWAEKALERAPDIPEVQDTVKRVREAKRK